MKLTGYIVCPKIYLFKYVTWDDDVISRDNYIMMSKQPPSWISKFFQKVRKPPKITEKYSKSIKQCKKPQEVKIIELKLIFINGNAKITNLENVCQYDVAMINSQSLVAFG